MFPDGALTNLVANDQCGCGSCGCGADESDQAAQPAEAALGYELDVSAIAEPLREARLYGAVAALVPGESLVVVATEDPAGLVASMEAEITGDLNVATSQVGPPMWRVSITRLTCC